MCDHYHAPLLIRPGPLRHGLPRIGLMLYGMNHLRLVHALDGQNSFKAQ